MIPITLPELGAGSQPIRISAWFVDPGDWVERGESVLEVLVSGMTCEITAPASGRMDRLAKDLDAIVSPGEIVGWLESGPLDDVTGGSAGT